MAEGKNHVMSRVPGMAYNLRKDLLTVSLENCFSIDTINKFLDKLQFIPAPVKTVPLLIDYRSTATTPSTGEIRSLARRLGGHANKLFTNIHVVVSEKHHYGMFRMARVYCEQEGVDLRIYHKMEEAYQALGFDETPNDRGTITSEDHSDGSKAAATLTFSPNTQTR